MNVSLGYNIKEVDKTIKWLKHAFLMPIYSLGAVAFYLSVAHFIFKAPSGFLPKWTLFILVPLTLGGLYCLTKVYLKIVLNAMAEYFKAKDLKRLLIKEGYIK